MKRASLRSYLLRRPVGYLLCGLILIAVFLPLGVSLVVERMQQDQAGGVAIPVAFNVAWLCGAVVTTWAALALLHFDRNPDIRALGRYGPPKEIMRAIEDELRGRHVSGVGIRMKALQLAG
jgi:hypothetical protein